MTDLNISWKDNSDIFHNQLNLNLKELSSVHTYPQHWKDFLLVIQNLEIKNLLDIGCGCGAYYSLIKQYHNHIVYTGIDYSDEAITIAKNQWKYNNFFVKDFWELDENFIRMYDVLHTSALFDVMNNGDEALDFVLGLHPKTLIISRMSLTNNDSYHETYLAYDKLKTYRYHHNINNFLSLCKKHNYTINKFGTNILLRYNHE